MKKAEFIARYGEAAYEKSLRQNRTWRDVHPEEMKEFKRKWRNAHQEEVKANSREQCRKGGKTYDKHFVYQHTGLQGERHLVRNMHGKRWCKYKKIVAPGSQIHHEWVPDTSDYRGVALVETDSHMHGIIDVIEVMEGRITLLTEEEVRTETRYNANHN